MRSSRTRAAFTNKPSRGFGSYGSGKNTREVAEELEAKYKIVETFVDMEEDFIIDILENSLADDVEKIIANLGKIPRTGISTRETDRIENKFRYYIQSEKFNGVIPGVPTLASLRGVSHLLPQPYSRKNPSRPSFQDTGLYKSSFRVWVEDLE